MPLHNVEQVRVQLNGTLAYEHAGGFDRRAAQKGLDLISLLEAVEGLDKWIEYGGHLNLILYHASPFAFDGKRAIAQVLIDPNQPSFFGDIKYLLPHEERPWEYCSGFAKDVPEAVELVLEALRRCENRDEYLYEILT